jgi:hypothetical protein
VTSTEEARFIALWQEGLTTAVEADRPLQVTERGGHGGRRQGSWLQEG